MFILFAVLVSLLVYAVLRFASGLRRQAAAREGNWAAASLAVLVAGLFAFSMASRAVGVDVGPFRAVSYDIPGDYLARGAVGLAALVPYALACLSPVLALAVPGSRR